jgi:hypothetical protein
MIWRNVQLACQYIAALFASINSAEFCGPRLVQIANQQYKLNGAAVDLHFGAPLMWICGCQIPTQTSMMVVNRTGRGHFIGIQVVGMVARSTSSCLY